MKRILSLFICAAIMIQLTVCVHASENSNINVTINKNPVTFVRDVAVENGEILFPFKELMGKLGFFIGYDSESNMYSGIVNDAEVKVYPDKTTANYDEVPIELNVKTRDIKDDVLIELRFIDMLYGIDFTQSGNYVDFSVSISKKEEQTNEEEFDVDKYLDSVTPKSVNISKESLFSSKLSDPALIATREVEVDGPGFTRALEMDNLVDSPRLYYDTQVTMPIESSVMAGDVLVLTFWARKIKCVDESGYAKFNTVYEQNGGVWSKYHSATEEKLTEEWQKFRYPFVVTADYSSGGAQVGIRIGFRLQTLQFGGVEVLNYGKKIDISLIDPQKVMKTTYKGREDGALWREEAFRRIEKYRKNDIKITVVDESGNPVPDAEISADMTRSEFLWGNAANQQKGFEAARNSIFYQDIQANKFNSFTNETGMKSGNFSMKNCVDGVNFVRKHNHYFRAHAIFWDRPDLWPAELSEDATEEEIKEVCFRFASKLSYFFKNDVHEIDVLNEPLNNDVGRTKYGDDFLVEIFKATRDLFPDARLFVNETGIWGGDANWVSIEKLKGIIDSMLKKGAPVEGIGVQDHASDFTYPQKLYNALDYLAENLKYIAITEYDYLSKLPSKTDALAVEADYLRDSIILAYSHPKTTSFTMWGFTDNGHWRGNAPLYDSNYNPKPAIKYWDKYVWGEWFTKAKAKTDENGTAIIRGHRGDYDITVTVNGQSKKTTLKLTKDGENAVKAVVKKDEIVLISSEEIKRNETEHIILADALFKEKESERYYLTFYENKADKAIRSTGENVSFLFSDKNKSVCSTTKNTPVTLKISDPLNKGYVTIKTGGTDEALVRVEVLDKNGEWKQIYAGESKKGEIAAYFEEDGVSQVKITGLTLVPAMLKNVKVSQKYSKFN